MTVQYVTTILSAVNMFVWLDRWILSWILVDGKPITATFNPWTQKHYPYFVLFSFCGTSVYTFGQYLSITNYGPNNRLITLDWIIMAALAHILLAMIQPKLHTRFPRGVVLLVMTEYFLVLTLAFGALFSGDLGIGGLFCIALVAKYVEGWLYFQTNTHVQ